MQRNWWLIVIGLALALGWSAVPNSSRDQRIAASLIGGIVLVIALAPGRMQHDDPAHPRYRPDQLKS